MEKTKDFKEKFSGAFSRAGAFFSEHWFGVSVAVVLALLAFFVRFAFFGWKSWDYENKLAPWFEVIRNGGGFAGLKNLVGMPGYDYPAAYMYILAIFSYFKGDSCVLIKISSIIFDFLMAFYVGLIARRFRKTDTTFCFAFGVTLFLPTVFLNSGAWAQCDSVFTCFLVMSFYYMLQGKGNRCMVFFALAFAMKTQAVFFAPVLVIALLKRKIPFYTPLVAILAYAVIGLPGIICGMGFKASYLNFVVQIGLYPSLTLNTPNLYNWIASSISEEWRNMFASGMVICAFGLTALALLPLYRSRYRTDRDGVWLVMAYFFAAFLPFILPHMHERYWFVADVFAVLFLCYNPKKWYIAVLLWLPSMYVVVSVLTVAYSASGVGLGILALLLSAGTGFLGYALYREVQDHPVGEDEDTTLFPKSGKLLKSAPVPEKTATEAAPDPAAAPLSPVKDPCDE